MVISWERKRMSRGLLIVEHWVLMEYETTAFCFLEKLQFHLAKCVVSMFFSYFHYWILILKLNMSRFEWEYFISINFMTCFNPNLDQNIGLWILYLPKKIPPSSILDILLPHNSVFQLTSHYLSGFSLS